eukprot:jgi/Mesen1/8098/ME000434S07340
MELHFRAILLVVGLLHALPVGGARHSPVLQLTATNSTSGSLSSLRAGLEYAYFERQYAGGWFTAGPVLNTHVEASMMSSVLSKRKTTHIPDSIDAYTISYPQTFAYFNIMWQPNSNNITMRLILLLLISRPRLQLLLLHSHPPIPLCLPPPGCQLAWRVVYEEDGTTFQASLNEYISEGFQLKQVSGFRTYLNTATARCQPLKPSHQGHVA